MKKPKIRCAIYTRKSHEEGLDQEFNSLDAQRETGEAFVSSQKSEGWVCLPTRYDDGGYSGGDMERPALHRLLEDIAAGKVDCVVIYKLDRLSRSLLDFARIMEIFDQHDVAFVSVTQQFNTATSMGRLMLNILLSFAQFEREIIGERIRDKIAAQRRKGKWAGGIPVLGYDVDRSGPSPKLVVNVTEAVQVRQIFEWYLQYGSLLPVVRELERQGWLNKEWVTKKGHRRGGRLFDKSSLHALLTNPIYRGQIKHKDQLYDGEHEPLVSNEIFDDVQKRLNQNGKSGGDRNKHNALLSGRLFCKACQRAMVHSFTSKSNRRYRYYLCSKANQNGRDACPSPSLKASEIEAVVLDQVRLLAENDSLRRQVLKQVRLLADQERQGWKDQRHGLEKELARHQAELKKVVLAEVQNEATTALVEYLQERIRGAENRIAELDARLANHETWDRDDVADALDDFDAVWATFSPREQRQLVGLLVSRVEFDPEDCSITLEFHATGIADVDRELGVLA